jgi:hypothetical protein
LQETLSKSNVFCSTANRRPAIGQRAPRRPRNIHSFKADLIELARIKVIAELAAAQNQEQPARMQIVLLRHQSLGIKNRLINKA